MLALEFCGDWALSCTESENSIKFFAVFFFFFFGFGDFIIGLKIYIWKDVDKWEGPTWKNGLEKEQMRAFFDLTASKIPCDPNGKKK